MITIGKSSQIADAIAARVSEVSDYENTLIDDGMNWQGNVIQVDANSQRFMLTIMLAYQLGQVNPSRGKWHVKSNIDVPMTDDQVKAMILAAQTYVSALMDACWAHQANIKAFTTLAAIEAYDITQGWPANNG